MLKTFIGLLGPERPVLARYLGLAVGHGLVCGLTTVTALPVLSHLLSRNPGAAALWLAGLLTGTIICWLLRRQVERAGVRVGVAVLQAGRHQLGDHLASLPIGWFTPANTARLGHLITEGLMAVAQLPAHVLTPVISAIVTPLVVATALLVIDPRLGLIAVLALPLLAATLILTGRLSRRADARYQQRFAEASQRMVEFAQAQSVIRAFQGEGGSARFLTQAMDDQSRAARQLIGLSTLATVLGSWVVQAIFAVLLLAAGLWLNPLAGAGVTAADLIGTVLVLWLVTRFIEPLLELAGYGEVLRGAASQLDAIGKLFAVAPMSAPLNDPGDDAAGTAPATADRPDHNGIAARVELVNLHFRYAPELPAVLNDLNLTIEAGSLTALIGESGSGKTTLLQLIARFHDPDQGQIRINGQDLRQLSRARLAGQFSQIFQDTYLFAGSIGDNIRLGKPAATEAEVRTAARLAGLGDLIEKLPAGLDTPVGEGGARLAGGERQRIGIARALIREAPILLVDEATSALDAGNQATITEALGRLRGRRTVIVVTHQLATIEGADQIVVVEGGRIVEHGTPAGLLARAGRYARFLAQQRAAEGWRIAPAVVNRHRPGQGH